jgi:hypothetical protein
VPFGDGLHAHARRSIPAASFLVVLMISPGSGSPPCVSASAPVVQPDDACGAPGSGTWLRVRNPIGTHARTRRGNRPWRGLAGELDPPSRVVTR